MQKKSLLALLILVLMAAVSCATAGASDEAIQESIRAQVRAEFPNTPVSVQVMNGRVTLNGVVETVDQRSTIVELARNTAGVRSVDNNLGVR